MTITNLINKAPVSTPKPNLKYVLVTPDMARTWLAANSGNRVIRAAKVNQYARDMEQGRWTLGADMICFGIDGKLLNGQHRLHAIIKSDCTVMLAIQYNTPAESMQNMDIGATRTTADALRWKGLAGHAPLLGSTGKLALLWESGLIYRDMKLQAISPSEISDFIDAHPEIEKSVAAALRHRNIDINPTPLAVAHYAIAISNSEAQADAFLERISSLAGEAKGSAVLALNSRLREIRRHKSNYTNRELLALVMKAWNYDVCGKPVSSLSVAQRGAFRIPEPHVRAVA